MEDAVNLLKQDKPKVLTSFWQTLSRRWNLLTLSQKLYLLALVILPYHQGWMVALPTGIALMLEFWPKFVRWWESLAGRALILLFYAAIANFAVAGAAGLVNDVTGVAAHNLSYSHNFAILLLFPTWAISVSLVMLLLFQVLLPIYLLAILLAKPFGEKGMRLFSQCRYPISTTLVRLLLSTMVLVNLMEAVQDSSQFAEGRQMSSSLMSNFADFIKEQGAETPAENASMPSGNNVSTDVPAASTPAKPEENSSTSFGLHIKSGDKQISCSVKSCDYRSFTRLAVANFVYFFESDSFSRCQLDEGARVVELNDYEILQVIQQPNAPLGFSFEVKKCISPAFGH